MPVPALAGFLASQVVKRGLISQKIYLASQPVVPTPCTSDSGEGDRLCVNQSCPFHRLPCCCAAPAPWRRAGHGRSARRAGKSRSVSKQMCGRRNAGRQSRRVRSSGPAPMATPCWYAGANSSPCGATRKSAFPPPMPSAALSRCCRTGAARCSTSASSPIRTSESRPPIWPPSSKARPSPSR